MSYVINNHLVRSLINDFASSFASSNAKVYYNYSKLILLLLE